MSEISQKEIWMKDEFNQATAATLRADIIAASLADPEQPIVLYINSYGGEVDSLNMLIDTVNSIPNKVITVCSGTAMSAGAFLLSCGSERYISPNSRVMIHQVQSMAIGSVKEMKKRLEIVNALDLPLLKMLAKNCGKTVKQLRTILEKNPDHFMTAKQAKKFGLVDYIGFPRVLAKKSYSIELVQK